MPMECPKCGGLYEQRLECPTCGVRLRFGTPARILGDGPEPEAIEPQGPVGRLIVGIFLVEGLALGMRMACDIGLWTNPGQDLSDAGSNLLEVVLPQTLQAACVLIGATLVGTGQRRGFLLGAVVGVIHHLIQLGIQLSNGGPLTEVVLYAQPLLYTSCGIVGGTVGSLIWRPMPTVALAVPLPPRKSKKRAPAFPIFAGPIAWPRVILGSAVAVAGVLAAPFVLDYAVTIARGELRITSHLQSHVLTWEIGGLAVLLGAILAGINTFNGLKQGLCVGVLAGLVAAGCRLADPNVLLEHAMFMAFCILCVSVIGGWLGCKLFPPVIRRIRGRGIIDAP